MISEYMGPKRVYGLQELKGNFERVFPNAGKLT